MRQDFIIGGPCLGHGVGSRLAHPDAMAKSAGFKGQAVCGKADLEIRGIEAQNRAHILPGKSLVSNFDGFHPAALIAGNDVNLSL